MKNYITNLRLLYFQFCHKKTAYTEDVNIVFAAYSTKIPFACIVISFFGSFIAAISTALLPASSA